MLVRNLDFLSIPKEFTKVEIDIYDEKSIALVYVENKGAAFGILENSRWIFIIFTVLVIAFFVYLVLKKPIKNKLFSISAILLIGGGIGNLIDRIFLGYVIDYLSLSFFPPVCNFADYCITAGVILLMIYFLFYYDKDKKVKENE